MGADEYTFVMLIQLLSYMLRKLSVGSQRLIIYLNTLEFHKPKKFLLRFIKIGYTEIISITFLLLVTSITSNVYIRFAVNKYRVSGSFVFLLIFCIWDIYSAASLSMLSRWVRKLIPFLSMLLVFSLVRMMLIIPGRYQYPCFFSRSTFTLVYTSISRVSNFRVFA